MRYAITTVFGLALSIASIAVRVVSVVTLFAWLYDAIATILILALCVTTVAGNVISVITFLSEA